METNDLIEHLHEWHENLISEMCAEDVLTCDDLCGYPGTCIVIQAANLLEAQQKRIAELEAALREQEERRWIPFSDPPKEKGCYFVTVKHWLDGNPVAREAYWNGADWLSCEKKQEITPRVTHWMPMPEPLKGDAK